MAKRLEEGQRGSEDGESGPSPGERRFGAEMRSFRRRLRKFWWMLGRGLAGLLFFVSAAVALFAFVNPPVTSVIATEFLRLGSVDRDWVAIESVPDHFPRSLVAAEDANFCLHWGFDLHAIRSAAVAGYSRGGSTISQQTAKNLFLWRGRSWLRKVLEVPITLLIEAIWTKQRILEVYMNIIEFDSGVFGVAEGARQHFGKEPDELTEAESARLVVVVPNPSQRNPFEFPPELETRVDLVQDGARTIAKDGRSTCFDVRISATSG